MDNDVVPASGIWEEIARWVVGILGTVSLLFFEGVRRWNNSRFNVVNKRIDDHKKITAEHSEKISSHETTLNRFDVHIENIKKNTDSTNASISRLHEKLDKVISGR